MKFTAIDEVSVIEKGGGGVSSVEGVDSGRRFLAPFRWRRA